MSTAELSSWNRPSERHSQGHTGFCGRWEEAPRIGKDGSNSSLALPVWTLVEEAMARDNLCGFYTLLDLCQTYFFCSGVLPGGVDVKKGSYGR